MENNYLIIIYFEFNTVTFLCFYCIACRIRTSKIICFYNRITFHKKSSKYIHYNKKKSLISMGYNFVSSWFATICQPLIPWSVFINLLTFVISDYHNKWCDYMYVYINIHWCCHEKYVTCISPMTNVNTRFNEYFSYLILKYYSIFQCDI